MRDRGLSVACSSIEYMFEHVAWDPPGAGDGRPALEHRTLLAWRESLGTFDRDLTDADRIDLIRGLEELKSAAAAAQAVLTADLDASQRRAQAEAGVPVRDLGKGIAHQVALARRVSPHRGQRELGLAKVLTHEMPGTLAALRRGLISEWRATLLARETACCSREDRAAVDRILTSDPERLASLGDKAVVDEVRRLAYRLDPHAVVDRHRRAAAERTVTLRPAPDTMTYLTALLPVEQGVAAYAALVRQADSLRASADGRSRGQAMADTLVQRITGQAEATDVAVEVRLVMTDRALLDGDQEPAVLEGFGVVPAGWARDLVADAAGGLRARLRRLFTAPTTGHLVALDSRSRLAPEGLASFVRARDQRCRTPWCGAPVRHVDHVVRRAAGGPTADANLQGLCEACNLAKEAPGWQALPRPGPRHTVEITTPTGHRHVSSAPRLPTSRPGSRAPTRMEACFADLLLAS